MEILLDTIQTAKNILTEVLLAYVRKHGENYSDNADYWYNEFGIEAEDGNKVTKVLDLFGNEGCESIIQKHANPDIDVDSCITLNELLCKINDEFTHNAYLQLYIEVSEDGGEALKYYCLYNEGISHSDDLSEPDHGYVRNLNLTDIENIIYVIHKTFKD